MTDSSTSTFTGLLNSFHAAADGASMEEESEPPSPPPRDEVVEEENQIMKEEDNFVEEKEEEKVVVEEKFETKENNFATGGIIDRFATATKNYFAQEEQELDPAAAAAVATNPHEDHHSLADEVDNIMTTQFTTDDGEEIVYRSMKVPTSSRRSHDVDDDHRDDDAYETDDYSTSVNNYDEETEAEETTATEGDFTEAEDEEEDDDDESSVGTARTDNSFNSLMVEMEHNEVSLREVVLDTTSMDRDTAEEMAQIFQKNTSISTIRLSCKRLGCKEGRTRKHHVLTTLLSGIKENNTIEAIEIEETEISHELAHHLSQLCARKQSLKNIAMIQCQFIGSGLAILFLGMQHSQSIRNVIFQSCDLGNNGLAESGGEQQQQSSSSYNVEIIASAIPLMHLTSLSLVDVHFPTEECLHYLLKNLEYCKELKLLDLSQNRLDVRSIALLCKSVNRQNQISRLVLSNCSLDNGSMKELTVGLRGYDPLTNLDISKNKHVSDRRAMNIKDLLKANSKILKLNVTGCSFSESSLDALEAALRYNNSFLKTFVSVSTGQQIFDVVDALANLGVGGDDDDDDDEEYEEEDDDVKDRRGGGGRRRGSDRAKQPSRTPKKSNRSTPLSPTVDRDWGDNSGRTSPRREGTRSGRTSPKRDEVRSLFDASFDQNGRDVKVHPSMHVQKVPRSPPPPPPPPPQLHRHDISQSGKISPSVRRNGNSPMAQLPFEDQVNFEDQNSSLPGQYGAKYASPQRSNAPVHQFNSTDDFFPSGSGQDFTGEAQYKSQRKSSNPSMPHYEFSSASSSTSQSGTFKPTRHDTRSGKYVSQRKNAVQKAPKIDDVIAQLSPSRRDVARSPRSPRGSTSGKRVML